MATEKALSTIRRHVRGTTMSPHDEVRRAYRPGILATGVMRSEMYSGMCPSSKATCEPASTTCTGSSQRLVTSATREELESHGHAARDPERCVPLRAGLAETVPVWKLEDRPAQRCNSPELSSRAQMVGGGGCPLLHEIFHQSDPPHSKTAISNLCSPEPSQP